MPDEKTDDRGGPEPMWRPAADAVETSLVAEFARFVEKRHGVAVGDYLELWEWSVADIGGFWAAVWDFYDVTSTRPYGEVLARDRMPGAEWFPGVELNFAEHALRGPGTSEAAVVSMHEDGTEVVLSWDDLRRDVAAVSAFLRSRGVGRGDRVVAYVASGHHAAVAFLATVAVGAVWSSCGQDYGAEGAAGRFGQLEPTVAFFGDGYHWQGSPRDRRAESERLLGMLPTVHTAVQIPHLGLGATGWLQWDDVLAGRPDPGPVEFERVPFDAPLWVLFSSGTTGPPKGIVHGHGGALLEHMKNIGLQHDCRFGDRWFWYTNTNWMMWNLVVSGLLVDSTVVLYDGSPTFPTADRLFDIAAEQRATVLGVSPGYLINCIKAGVRPEAGRDLSRLRILGSTGSPLPTSVYGWVHENVRPQVQLMSSSGGTDIVSALAGGSPTTPVWAGEISAPMLGVAVDTFGADGTPVRNEVGELVVTRPMPSMPVGFWNDDDGSRYTAAYFDTFPGIWRHGDLTTITDRGSMIISGRSDSTLNRQGVRIGSADIYNVVERLDEVKEALVIGAEMTDGTYWMPLFIVPADGVALDDTVVATIVSALRTQASPRHVPDEVVEVAAIPHTRTGKKLEVPVKRIIQGATLQQATARESVDDIEALVAFEQFRRG